MMQNVNCKGNHRAVTDDRTFREELGPLSTASLKRKERTDSCNFKTSAWR